MLGATAMQSGKSHCPTAEARGPSSTGLLRRMEARTASARPVMRSGGSARLRGLWCGWLSVWARVDADAVSRCSFPSWQSAVSADRNRVPLSDDEPCRLSAASTRERYCAAIGPPRVGGEMPDPKGAMPGLRGARV